jgi:hypothetical protein
MCPSRRQGHETRRRSHLSARNRTR